MELSDRRWKDIPGFGGMYRVSDHGDILSLHNSRNRISPLGYMKPQNMKNCWAVSLRNNGRSTSHAIAHLVAIAFRYPELDEDDISRVSHLDGDMTNCHIDNLYVHFRPSAADKILNGRHYKIGGHTS